MKLRKDLTGQKFGRLKVEKFSHIEKRHYYWLCQCECGNKKIVEASKLKNGMIKSCGCYQKESRKKQNKTHGKTNTRIYHIWQSIKQRCENGKCKAFRYYGGRGILICDEWKNDFKAFYDWAINNGYQEDLTIDRIDVNGNYEPSNCRWTDRVTQANNTRRNHYIEHDNKKKTLAEWERETGIPQDRIYDRLYKGWSIEKTLNTPYKRKKNVTQGNFK